MKRIHKLSFVAGLVLGIVVSSFTVFGSGFSLPHPVFVSGEVISAQKINENFQAIVNQINNGSSSSAATNILSHQVLNLTSADNGKFFVIHKSVKMFLPSLASVDPGYRLRFSQKLQGQTVLVPVIGDFYNGQDDLMVLESNYQSAAYLELISTGSEWIHTISTNGSFARVDASKIVSGTCSGNGSGSGNCYENTTAMNINDFGYIMANNYLHSYDGLSWRRMGTTYYHNYLINDSSSLLPAFSYTKDYNLAQYGPSQSGPLVYFHNTYMGTYPLSSILNGIGSLMAHGGSNLENDLNTKIENNFLNPGSAYYGFGSHCQSQLGKDWKLITNSQTSSLSGPIDFWTASSGTNPNEYIYVDGSETAVATDDHNMISKSLLCVYQP